MPRFPPHFSTQFFYCFLQLESIAMHCNFKIVDSVATGQVADGVSGKKEDRFGFAAASRICRRAFC